jgi:pyruvate, water dikinase
MQFSTLEEKAATGQLVKTIDVPAELRNRYSLTDVDVETLASYAIIIEDHYGRPMDIEWGKDGLDGELYILQARPETVKSQASGKAEHRYKLKGAPLARRLEPVLCASCITSVKWTRFNLAMCWSLT